MKKLGHLLGVAACGALVACTSGGSADPTVTSTAPSTTTAAETAGDPGVRLTGLVVSGDEAQTVVQLKAEGSLSIYSSYNPEPTLVVIDVPNGQFDPALADAVPPDPRIRSLKLNRLTEFGRPFARLEVRVVDGSAAHVDRIGETIALRVAGPVAPKSAPLVSEAGAVSSEPLPSAALEEPAPIALAAAPQESEAASATPSLETPKGSVKGSSKRTATRLEKVRAAQNGAQTVVEFFGNGGFEVRDFYLSSPNRLVVDLPGVTNQFSKKSVDVSHNGIGRVRISQFQLSPEPVCRVVLDLDQKLNYEIEKRDSGARLVLSTAPLAPAAVVAAASAESTPAPAPIEPTPASETVASPSSTEVAMATDESATTTATMEAPVADAPVDATPTTETADASSQSSSTEPIATEEVAPAEPPTVVAVVKAEEPGKSTVAVEPAATFAPATESAPETIATKKPRVEEEALFEAAEAFLADAKEPEIASPGKFSPKTISESDQKYVGEPISLHLKDADIKDTFRSISTLTGLNIVLDPEVGGKVTLDLEEVPWDQALELILKVNNLSYQLDGNVMRIGSTNRLKNEEAQKKELEEAKELSQAQKTVIKPLSYSKAEALREIVYRVMSKRGDVIVDPRTNVLILRDIPSYLEKAIQLISNLDIPQKQVVIEARIVETTKNFSRQLGVSWGFLGQSDAAHGNASNFVFPYDGALGGGVGLPVPSLGPGGGPLLSMTIGSILDTFNLDLALSAAEADGLAKVVSSPKVATETNYQATIQSGVQIPVQTTANNTTSVAYIDATLRLQVTPQITELGTIIMDISVQKKTPLVGISVAGGTNVPLSTRDAKKRVLVKDGGTAVIGGIYEISSDDAENRVPGLWDIPFLGALFRNKVHQNKHDELLIFITPHIVKG